MIFGSFIRILAANWKMTTDFHNSDFIFLKFGKNKLRSTINLKDFIKLVVNELLMVANLKYSACLYTYA